MMKNENKKTISASDKPSATRSDMMQSGKHALDHIPSIKSVWNHTAYNRRAQEDPPIKTFEELKKSIEEKYVKTDATTMKSMYTLPSIWRTGVYVK